MRINRFIAAATGMSCRSADSAIEMGQVLVNGKPATLGHEISSDDIVAYNGHLLKHELAASHISIILNKPVGYVCSRNGQGSHTIYELLPEELHQLKSVGRLDKDSSGLLLLTNDGELAHQLTHPRFHKVKQYDIELDKSLQPLHHQMISEIGVTLEDGLSTLALERLQDSNDTAWKVIMHEGRNRQIRRTFAALGYTVRKLHRTDFGPYALHSLQPGKYQHI